MKNHLYFQKGFFDFKNTIGICAETGFQHFLIKLNEIQSFADSAGIIVVSPYEISKLFDNMEIILNENDAYGNRIEIYNKVSFLKIICDNRFDKTDNVHKAWNLLLHDIAEDIDTLCQYGYSHEDSDSELAFLRNALVFMSQFVIDDYTRERT